MTSLALLDEGRPGMPALWERLARGPGSKDRERPTESDALAVDDDTVSLSLVGRQLCKQQSMCQPCVRQVRADEIESGEG